MAYYYWNKLDGRVVWTMPEPEDSASRDRAQSRNRSNSNRDVKREMILQPNRLRSDSSVSQTRQHNSSTTNRLSMYSDDSDVHPHEPERSYMNTNVPPTNGIRGPMPRQAKAGIELTSAERLAQALQKTLDPSPPELVADLSATARKAIAAVVENIQINGFARRWEEDTVVDGLVRDVVFAVRNLLYVSAAPTGHIPSHLVPREARDARANTSTQALLKPAQRKVTATLSKVVLSARAMQYDSGSATMDTSSRIEGDAEELERAVIAFVLEVERCYNQVILEQVRGKTGLKRLHGIFLTANVGLGLVGAGAAGSWKGFGWVALDEDEESPGRILGTEVVNELGAYLLQVEHKLNALSQALRSDNSGIVFSRLGMVLLFSYVLFLLW
jgi:son of sevenless-like protein